ncbi:hypothetical protein AB8Q18_08450 [Neisseriaceae bacterium CLB008]
MSEFSAEEQGIIDFFLDQYQENRESNETTQWLSKDLSKICAIIVAPSVINKDTYDLTFIDPENKFKQKIIHQIKIRIVTIYSTLKRLEQKGLIFTKPSITFTRLQKEKKQDQIIDGMFDEMFGVFTEMNHELDYICSIIIPSGALLELKRNKYVSADKIAHEKQIKYLRLQAIFAYFALGISIIGPAFYSLKPTAITIHDKTPPLPMAINSEKIDALNQEVIRLEAKVESLKSEAVKIQAKLSKPDPETK